MNCEKCRTSGVTCREANWLDRFFNLHWAAKTIIQIFLYNRGEDLFVSSSHNIKDCPVNTGQGIVSFIKERTQGEVTGNSNRWRTILSRLV